jgi:hypothetical protein
MEYNNIYNLTEKNKDFFKMNNNPLKQKSSCIKSHIIPPSPIENPITNEEEKQKKDEKENDNKEANNEDKEEKHEEEKQTKQTKETSKSDIENNTLPSSGEDTTCNKTSIKYKIETFLTDSFEFIINNKIKIFISVCGFMGIASLFSYFLYTDTYLEILHCIKNIESSAVELEDWIIKHNITFNNTYEYEVILENYILNDFYICKQNLLGNSYSLAHNQFSGMNSSQWLNYVMNSGMNMPNLLSFDKPLINNNIDLEQLPSSINWVTNGVVTPVKNQGLCGACWAFSAIASLESAYKISGKYLHSFSEQELINCNTETNNGCNGGNYELALEWVKKNKAISIDYAYPYGYFTYKGISDFQTCGLEYHIQTPINILKVHKLPPYKDDELINVLSKYPVSVAINANPTTLQFYSSGIYDDTDCDGEYMHINHAVTIVGYTENSYIIKNSWGTGWGDNGYMSISRKPGDTTAGLCGILTLPVYPEVK